MRRVLSVILQLGIMLLVLLVLFSGVLWCLARYWWGYDLKDFSFLDMLVLGLVRFWENGPGTYVAAVCAVMGFVFALQWLTDLWKLKKKREAVGRDVENRAKELAESMRQGVEARVLKAHEKAAVDLRRWNDELIAQQEELHAHEQKVDAYLKELKALRSRHTHYALEREEIRHRAKQALDALSRDVPVVGEARRLIKKVIQLA